MQTIYAKSAGAILSQHKLPIGTCMATVDSSLVAHLPLFAGLAGDELAEVLSKARSRRYVIDGIVNRKCI